MTISLGFDEESVTRVRDERFRVVRYERYSRDPARIWDDSWVLETLDSDDALIHSCAPLNIEMIKIREKKKTQEVSEKDCQR